MDADEAQPASPVAVNDGAEDVVEAELTASDAHHTHLVEGDFFPAEAPPVEGDVNEEGDALVDAIAASAAASAAASIASAPQKPAAVASRKRVRWADEPGTSAARGLVKHVTNFYMPTGAHGARHDDVDLASPSRPMHVAAVNPAPSLFREKTNADGTVYKFCKAQRPASSFVEWRRHPREYGTAPFEPQPAAIEHAAATTLFGELFHRSVVARVAEGHVRQRTCAHHRREKADDDFQLPFVRTDAAFDEPHAIPL